MTTEPTHRQAVQRLFTSREAASILCVSPNTMNFWRATRRGPAYVKVGHFARYRPEDIESYLNSRRVETPDSREASA
jgi:hypothetical protein